MRNPTRSFAVFLGAVAAAACAAFFPADAGGALEQGWAAPPTASRVRAYWWWLNGDVTKAAITRDLKEMKAKGWGGALICDAGGAEQDGNAPVRHGPNFLSPKWLELFRHALNEAARLGLVMSVNIQSGWNLGGPPVGPEDAAKKLTWSVLRVKGPRKFEGKLPPPPRRDGYYRDAFVVAYPLRERLPGALERIAAPAQKAHPPELAVDGDPSTYWVSSGDSPGRGPSPERPVELELRFRRPITADELRIVPRPGYGPKAGEVWASADGRRFEKAAGFSMEPEGPGAIRLAARPLRALRIRIVSAYDPRFPNRPRNAQIAELELLRGGRPIRLRDGRPPIRLWAEKAVYKTLHFSAPDTAPLLFDRPPMPDEADAASGQVRDLTDRLSPDGALRWDAPSGEWEILRFGWTIADRAYVSTSSDGWKGYALDVFDAEAFQRYWAAVVEPLLAAAGPHVGKTLQYLHTDSWEIEAVNWTPRFPEEFRKRRGYDLIPYAPALAGRIVDSREASNRFLEDFRRTLADLAIDNHYRPFRENAHRRGLKIHPESGGPHAVPIDAQQCLGFNDVPMSEFWAWSWRHRIGDPNRFFCKQPASAAHTCGRRLVAAEGFTTIGPHWQERIWNNLKPSFDKALCEGMNLLFWHAVVCSPAEEGLPGIQYFAGTHFNPNSTWWPKSAPFIAYMNRCQWMLQQGRFVADVVYYYGDHAPNFARLKEDDPARVRPGFDYDVISADALLNRLQVKDGRLVLPDGMSYRLLVLPNLPVVSLPVLRKVKALAEAGAAVLGSKPERAAGWSGCPEADREVRRLADALWGSETPSGPAVRRVGRGLVLSGMTGREALRRLGVAPDIQAAAAPPASGWPEDLDWIHRRVGQAEVYFVANRSEEPRELLLSFRVAGRAPELWNPDSGERRFAAAYEIRDGRTLTPLSLDPCGSVFVVFREPAEDHPPYGTDNALHLKEAGALEGPWDAAFDPAWGGPAHVRFQRLVDWTERPEPGIRYYSGAATYSKRFDLPPAARAAPRLWLDLGDVRELAEVRLNGRRLGVVWRPPFRVEITGAVKPVGNLLEVEVVNFWPNRIIGDRRLPPEKRRTRTNIRKLTAKTPLMKSGLLGPVRLMTEKRRPRS